MTNVSFKANGPLFITYFFSSFFLSHKLDTTTTFRFSKSVRKLKILIINYPSLLTHDNEPCDESYLLYRHIDSFQLGKALDNQRLPTQSCFL